jgi:3-oxoacyl-[acyl-carrier protein] reductase
MMAQAQGIQFQGTRRVLVTGGGRGLGAAIVRALSAAGHDVTFTYRSSGDAAAAAVKSLAADFPEQKFAALPIDLSDRDAVAAFTKEIDDGRYDGLVHNAGHTYDALAMMMDQAKAEVAMQVNYWSFTRIASALMRPMMRARSGRVAVIGSITALQANQGNAAYAASKAALLAYVRTLAVEVARNGVTVNYVAPGFIDTEMMAPYAKYREQMESQIPSRRFAAADEIAAVAVFLMSPGASYLTGAVLPVDGGLSAAIGVHR